MKPSPVPGPSLAALIAVIGLTFACAAGVRAAPPAPDLGTAGKGFPTSEDAATWQSIYSVLVHPRCLNCHTATTYPQQGDERRRHFANVTRGGDGHGVPALNCASCHQVSNANSTGAPGAPGWHLAPLSMRWQDANNVAMTSPQVCQALTDRQKNHGLDGPGLVRHNEDEPLVLWAWRPGRRTDGAARSTPPLTHAQFVAATRRWVAAGMPCPEIVTP